MRLPPLIAASVLLCTDALAADRFVTTRGTDASNTCASSSAPCRTLAHAIGQASSGDVVKLAAGTYATNLVVDAPVALTVSGGWNLAFTQQDAPRKTPRTRLSGNKLDRVLALVADAGAIDVTLDNVTIMRGRASTGVPAAGSYGSGVLAMARNGGTLSLTIRRTAVMQNQANTSFEVSGGGLLAFALDSSSVDVDVEDTSFENNAAERGGGIAMIGTGNVAVDLKRAILRRNVARGSGRGGAVWLDRTAGAGSTAITIEESIIEGNQAHEGGALSLQGNVGATVTNTVVRANRASSGVVSLESRPDVASPQLTLSSSTLVTSERRFPPSLLQLEAGTASVVSSIVWGTGPAAAVYVNTTLDLDHSNVGALAFPGVPGTVNDLGGNISVDPQFVRANGADVHLKPTSPCVDAGTCAGAPPIDVDGDPRPTGAQCDMGADELAP